MNKKYCIKCGASTEYSFKQPSFCESCGQPFASATFVTKTQKTLENKSPRKSLKYKYESPDDDNDDDDDDDEYDDEREDYRSFKSSFDPKLMKPIKIEVKNLSSDNKIKLGQIIGTAPQGSSQKLPKRNGVNFEEWKKKAFSKAKKDKSTESESVD